MNDLEELRDFLLERAGGRCECRLGTCPHHLEGARCRHQLQDGWIVYRMRAESLVSAAHCKAMCPTCHEHAPRREEERG